MHWQNQTPSPNNGSSTCRVFRDERRDDSAGQIQLLIHCIFAHNKWAVKCRQLATRLYSNFKYNRVQIEIYKNISGRMQIKEIKLVVQKALCAVWVYHMKNKLKSGCGAPLSPEPLHCADSATCLPGITPGKATKPDACSLQMPPFLPKNTQRFLLKMDS